MAPSSPANRHSGAHLNQLRKELEAAYASHFDKLCGYFRRCGQSDPDARDLAQETFVKALRGLAAFEGQSRLTTWLWSIAHHVLVDHIGQTKRLPGDSGTAADPDTLASHHDVSLEATRDCVRRGFEAFAIAHPERAMVVYLAVVEGWTREELAEHLERSVHAATEYLSQCKAKLRPFISSCGNL